MKRHSLAKAVFLDRDGVLNPLIYYPDAGIVDSPFTATQFKLFPRVARAVRLFNELGLRVIVVSNQPGIAKKHFTAEVLRACERKLMDGISRGGGRVDAIYYCLHHPDSKVKSLRKHCRCRKPGIGMLQAAARRFKLSLSDCYMVGDGITDIVAGRRAGCKTVLIGKWKCENCQHLQDAAGGHPDMVAKDLWAAATLIREQVKSPSSRNNLGCSDPNPPRYRRAYVPGI